MSSEARYRIAAPDVVHQEIDGEVVLIHLTRGTYHSVRGSGAVALAALERGATARDVEAALAASHDGDAATIARETARFLEDLSREGLVVADAAPGAAPPAPPSSAAARRPFEPPRVETFSDLQELILADPIHDVGEAGWPHLPPAGGGA